MMSGGARLRLWGPAAVFFGMAAALTVLFHNPLPYYDHWDLAPLYDRMLRGTLTVGDIFRPHGGHWHATALMVQLMLAKLTHMSHLAEALASLLIAGLGAPCLLATIRRAAAPLGSEGALAWAFGLSAFIFYSLDQAPNWLWGWQVAVFLNTTGVVAVVWLLTRPRLTILGVLGALLASWVAIFAFATGLALLPIGLLLILLGGHSLKRRLIAAGVWSLYLVGVLAWFDLTVVKASSSYLAATTGPQFTTGTALHILRFATDMAGAAIARFSDGIATPATLIGAVAFGLAVLKLRRATADWKIVALPFLAFALYGLGAGALTGIGRLGFGADQALISRYISFGNFYWLGVLGLAALAAPVSSSAARRVLVGLCIFFLLLKLGNIANVVIGKDVAKRHEKLLAVAQQLRDSYPAVPADLQAQVAEPGMDIASRIAVLRREKASFFRE